jgi:prevent-host-death family protein
MRYMSTRSGKRRRPPSDHVGVRELRQYFSVYLARVVKGETLRVTDRGRPVAILAPLPEAATVAERLVASGRAVAATGDLGDLPALPADLPADLANRAQKSLHESRGDAV